MVDVLVWLVAAEVLGLAAFPLCYQLFPRLRDRGYSVAKPAGLLLVGYLSWILSVLHVLPSTRITVAALVVLLAGASGAYAWAKRQELWSFVTKERSSLLIGEGLFLAIFVVWVGYRAYDPAIDHTEQPMDFAFLNASIRSHVGQPEDPWLRGETVSYYYFGYWNMGLLSKLTGLASNVTYNLSMALVPAMAAAGIFGLVFNMVSADSRRLRYAVAGGLGAALLLVGAANLEGVLEFMRANGIGSGQFWDWVRVDGLDGVAPTLTESWRPHENWWWWRATRVISTFEGDGLVDYTIHEFPFFSYMLGDLHPHVMSLPFVILFLAVCWNFLRSADLARREFRPNLYVVVLIAVLVSLTLLAIVPLLVAPSVLLSWTWRIIFGSLYGLLVLVGVWVVWRAYTFRGKVTVLVLALTLGGLGFTNAWDLPVFAALALGVLGLKAYWDRRGGALALRDVVVMAVPYWALVLAIAVGLFLPYYLTFTSQVSGISAVEANTSRSVHTFIVWSLFLVAVTPFIIGVFWRTTVREDWAGVSLASLVAGFLPYVVWAFLYLQQGGTTAELVPRFFHVLPFALLIGIAVYSALWLAAEDGSNQGMIFALGLSALGLLLIMGPELLYVDDSFSGAHERMNTVFKLYYQGWTVLAAASGFAIYYWSSLRETVRGGNRVLVQLWAAVLVVLVVGAAYYPLAAAASKGNLFHGQATLDGLAYTSGTGRGEYGAIRYIRENAGPDSAVLEAVGGDYSPFGRISASTGVPTVLGWAGHELQWRGSADPAEGRAQDVEAIYQTLDVDEAKTLLAKYGVDYVYVGPRETSKYGADGLEKFSDFMERVYDEGGVVVYRMPP